MLTLLCLCLLSQEYGQAEVREKKDFSFYEIIAKRNLFKPLGQPVAQPKKQPKKINPKTVFRNLILTGIVAINGTQQATIEDKGTRKGLFVSEGEEVKPGIKLVRIEQEQVILESQGVQIALSLRKKRR